MTEKVAHGLLKRRAALAIVLLLGVAAIILCSELNRPIWFDEAITVMYCVMRPYPEIYSHYAFPTNHILYTYCLRLWVDTVGGAFPVSEVAFRLLSAFIALALVGLTARFWRKRLGFHATLVVTACLVVSVPFAIYGTAMRSYILSMLLVLCGVEAFLRWESFGTFRAATLFFLVTLAGISTIPSNVFSFSLLCVLPTPKTRKTPDAFAISAKRRVVALLLVFVASALFYGPIWRQLQAAMLHNNGWGHAWAACGHLGAGFIFFFIPVIAVAVPGVVAGLRKRPLAKMTLALSVAVALAPFIVTLARLPAPCPRVFLPIWPIWMYLVGRGAARTMAWARKKGIGPWRLTGPALALIVLIGLASRHWDEELSDLFTHKGSQDDFFSPYYARPDFQPLRTVEKLLKMTKGQPKRVYLSQNTDFPSIIFYGKLKGVQEGFWQCDFPGRKSIDVPRGGILVVVHGDADLCLLEKRFHLKTVRPIYEVGPQRIYLEHAE